MRTQGKFCAIPIGCQKITGMVSHKVGLSVRFYVNLKGLFQDPICLMVYQLRVKHFELGNSYYLQREIYVYCR